MRSLSLLALAVSLLAVGPARATPIQDNSFLLEEAYNQEPGVIQHIGTFHRVRGGEWLATYTEEWPAPGQTHQLSASFALQGGTETGAGDIALNYRWQAVGSGEAPVAISPRLSLLVPGGAGARGFGSGGWGGQVNLPASVTLGSRFVSHTNAGATWVPSASTPAGRGVSWGANLGQSLVWLLHQRVNLLVETVYAVTRVSLDGGGSSTERSLLLSPGIRGAVDVGRLQIVPGLAVPIGMGPSAGERGAFFYLSFEHPAFDAG
jgi:hypothetical protein